MKFDINNMLHPGVYNHSAKSIVLIETHISWVLLTGHFAYKIKKPVDFGFLDFSTLRKRKTCCEQEVYLNRRLAPDIYFDVVRITGEKSKPKIDGRGDILEYAVKMVQFQQSCQLDNMLDNGELGTDKMDKIARMIGNFHQTIKVADKLVDYGEESSVLQPVEENFTQIAEHVNSDIYEKTLSKLQQWSKREFEKLKPVIKQRKKNGFVRECHGDMHLRNLVWLDNGPIAFDCIEFNEYLRWIDVISEISFLVMDLQVRQHQQLANRFLNVYLEATGDYAGLAVLTFYLCYRALVRAKVEVLRLEQKNVVKSKRKKSLIGFELYLELASSYMRRRDPKLIIMRGVSASGKSTISQYLADELGFIRIRSDVERKRLFNVSLTDDSSCEIDAGIYSEQSSIKTYKKLAELASVIIHAGYSVIVDAAFLKHEQCESFREVANQLSIPFVILEATAPIKVLQQRIVDRAQDISDADILVLNHQYSNWSTFEDADNKSVISIDTSKSIDYDVLVNEIMLR